MTVVGKILVFLNLVFSLVVGLFAIMTHVAGTDYKKANDLFAQRYTMLDASQQAYAKETAALRAEKEELAKSLQNLGVEYKEVKEAKDAAKVAKAAVDALSTRDKQISDLKDKVVKLETERDAASKNATARTSTTTIAQADLDRYKNESTQLRDSLEKQAIDNVKLVGKMNDQTNRLVKSELERDSYLSRSQQLDEQVKALATELAQLKSNFATASASKTGPGTPTRQTTPSLVMSKLNPPADNIEGQVTKIDGRLVAISVGSDAGLAKGNTMLVFRLRPEAKFIGNIRLLEVKSGASVGEWVDRPRYPVQIGDRVGSQILGN